MSDIQLPTSSQILFDIFDSISLPLPLIHYTPSKFTYFSLQDSPPAYSTSTFYCPRAPTSLLIASTAPPIGHGGPSAAVPQGQEEAQEACQAPLA